MSTPGGTEYGRTQYTVRSFRVRRVLAAVLALPVIELAIAIAVAGWIGVWPTVIALFLLSATGFLVLRREGRQAWRALGGEPATPGADLRRRDPAEAALVALAGLLLMVPGFLTGLGGLALLVPPIRRWVRRRIARSTGNRWPGGGRPVIRGEVVQGETVGDTEPPRNIRPPEDPSAGPPAVTG